MIDGTGNIGAGGANGDIFTLRRTDAHHYAGKNDPHQVQTLEVSFRDSLLESLNGVNDAQIRHESLSVQAIVDPESVDPHDLTIASAEANLSLNIAKNVIDRVIQAYRQITNLT